MTFINFQDEAYTEEYQDSIEAKLANLSDMEEARYALGDEICSAISFDSLDLEF